MLVLPSFSSFPSPRRRTRFFFPLSLPERLLFLSYDGPSVDPFAVRGTRDPLLSAILRCPSSPPTSRFSEIPTPDSDAARSTLDAYRCVTQAKSHPGRAGFLSRFAISSVSILQRAVPVFAGQYAYFHARRNTVGIDDYFEEQSVSFLCLVTANHASNCSNKTVERGHAT